jgi:AraC-like DNA-binding protein/mannose-6-phosphate isomerase-like protein (cupin superfamily)
MAEPGDHPFCTEGGSRTHKPVRTADFESAAFAIPPLRPVPVLCKGFQFGASVSRAKSDQRRAVRRVLTVSRRIFELRRARLSGSVFCVSSEDIASSLVHEGDRSQRVHASTWRDPGRGSPRWPAAAHEGVEIAWCVAGTATYEVGTKTLEVGAGALIIIPNGVEHRTRLASHANATSIKVDAVLVAEALDDLAMRSLNAMIVPQTDVVSRIGSLIVGTEARRSLKVNVDALARSLVRRLLEPMAARPVRRDPRIRRALQCIEERLADPLEITDLARAAGMSRFHFSRSFRAETGTSPYQWLLTKRVERAAELFKTRRLTVTDAAFEVGFSDLSRFARAFRDQFGCPPSSFAAA